MKSVECPFNDLTPSHQLDGDVGDGEAEEDDVPSLLSDIGSHSERHAADVYSHDDLGLLCSSKAPTSNRDLPLPGSLMGIPAHALGGLAHHENMGVGAGILVAVEKQRLELEKQRLAVETERLAVEKERLAVEKERLRQMEVEKERLQLDRERLEMEKERVRLLLLTQSAESADSSFNLPPPQDPPSSSSFSMERESKGWMSVMDLESERLKLEKERLQLEKERLQFFKFEAGILQIERERLQVEKERMQLHKEHQSQ